MLDQTDLRKSIDEATYADEAGTVAMLTSMANLSSQDRARIGARACGLVRTIRNQSRPGLMEVFLA